MSHTILYTSDVHGNLQQLEHLLQHAREIKPYALIIAGEIAPKGAQDAELYLAQQKAFVNHDLPRFAQRVKEILPETHLYIGLGNDDTAVLVPLLEQHEKQGLFRLLNKRHALTHDRDIVGYFYVPLTPFAIKDFEKYDFSSPPTEYREAYEHLKRTNYCLEGVKSSRVGWSDFAFTPHLEQHDSIQKDLEKQEYTANAKKTLCVFHAPPYYTALDMLYTEQHVGSLAVRAFIEHFQPAAALHGHIHETVDVSGRYVKMIGGTPSMSAGNHNVGESVAALVFDVYAPEKARRVVLPKKRGIFSFAFR